MSFNSFPKIFQYGEARVSTILDGYVEVTEKVDGSQWAFGLDANGKRIFRSKGQVLTDVGEAGIPNMFKRAYKVSNEILDKGIIPPNTILYCEYLSKPKHNILSYGRIPYNNLYLFGMCVNGEFVHDCHTLSTMAINIDIEPPRVMYEGDGRRMPDVASLLETDSILGNEKVEGVVIKNHGKEVLLKGHEVILPIMCAKYVSAKFQERHKSDWKKKHTSRGNLGSFVESFKTEARWHKALQHLRESGELEFAPSDIGILIKEIQNDILEEEKDNIKEHLFELFKGDIMRRSIAGFPEWYKERLTTLPLE